MIRGDTIYAIDVVGEAVVTRFAETLAASTPSCWSPRGCAGGRRCYPEGRDEASVDWWIIVDPIDGTRGLMYQKRSAWVLTGVAPNRGPATSLRDVVLAVQTEIPLVKQHLSDQMWAVRGEGVQAHRYNRLTRERASDPPDAVHGRRASRTVMRRCRASFPGARDELAALDEAIVLGALGPHAPGKAHCFEDQYASTGGQLYELLAGHDRFVADLRPLVRSAAGEQRPASRR